MRILVDADACPVKDAIITLANKNKIEVHFFADVNHELSQYDAIVHTTDQGRDSADFALIGTMEKGDIVITSDYGVASLAIGRGGYILHPSGKRLHHDNIDLLMFERHLSQKSRQAGLRGPKHKKRSVHDNLNFYHALEKLIYDTQ
jgi:uncharacterized protein YaiI (UPF0178 family)